MAVFSLGIPHVKDRLIQLEDLPDLPQDTSISRRAGQGKAADCPKLAMQPVQPEPFSSFPNQPCPLQGTRYIAFRSIIPCLPFLFLHYRPTQSDVAFSTRFHFFSGSTRCLQKFSGPRKSRDLSAFQLQKADSLPREIPPASLWGILLGC